MEAQLLYGQPVDEQTRTGEPSSERATRFHYAATPNPVPCSDGATRSTVTLMIAVANTSGEDQYCSQIIFRLPTTGRGALTTKPGEITVSRATGTDWSIESNKLGTLTATTQSTDPFRAGDSIAFILENVEVAQDPGLVAIEVQETIGGGIREGLIQVTRMSQGLAITRLTATPIQVSAGQKTRLVWTTTGATTCSLAWDGRSRPVRANDSHDDSPSQTTTYTLTASGGGTTVVQQITVIVAAVRIRSFGAAPRSLAVEGKTTLSWNVDDATRVTIEPDIGEVLPSGSRELTLYQTTAYTLTAEGTGGQVDTRQFTVTVEQPAVITSFTASPSGRVNAGTQVTISWQTANVSGVTIDQGIGSRPPRGSVVVTPEDDTTYTLTCSNLNGSTSATLKIEMTDSVVILSFTAGFVWERQGPLGPMLPVADLYSWRVRNATSYEVSGRGPRGTLPGKGKWSRTETTPRQSSLGDPVTLTCQGPNGPVSKTVRFSAG